ncbi:acyl-CoA dehydrogenase family protein [Fictibacillus aquaticus]|uniref:Acyl-CoA dehydrogenase n=1 Tax=Fictibacillus aquaticus TaxID=2021314 RepID=A0A235F5R5_9BACL|nr:acyl-CoA dehydrogenase family protein [Fictibacillus aquaticus]OYD56621.1 acyl-CoA dehydrogenase [Fictibacillus aquaticus]
MHLSFFTCDKQKAYIKKLDVAVKHFADRAAELDESNGFPFENIKELKDFGYTKLTLPKEYGGLGGTLMDYLLGQETIARYCGATSLSIGWHVGVVLEIVERKNWSEEKLKSFFEKVAAGALVNRAGTEPQTGSPTRGGRPQTTAVRKDSGWVLNGRKTFTTLAPVLDIFLVSAWIEEEEKVAWFYVERELPGVSIDETWNMIAMQGTGSHDLVLDQVEVKEEDLVEYSEGRTKSSGWLLHIPATYIGIAAAARNEAVEFAKTYSPNSLPGPIGDLPNVQRLIGEMDIELAQARHFLYSVAEKWQISENPELLKDMGAVKYCVTNAALSIVDKAMRVAGARSLQKANPLQRFYRDVRAGLHNPPMDDSVVTLFAKSALENKMVK